MFTFNTGKMMTTLAKFPIRYGRSCLILSLVFPIFQNQQLKLLVRQDIKTIPMSFSRQV